MAAQETQGFLGRLHLYKFNFNDTFSNQWSRGAMVNVFAYGMLAAKDSRFESWRDRDFFAFYGTF